MTWAEKQKILSSVPFSPRQSNSFDCSGLQYFWLHSCKAVLHLHNKAPSVVVCCSGASGHWGLCHSACVLPENELTVFLEGAKWMWLFTGLWVGISKSQSGITSISMQTHHLCSKHVKSVSRYESLCLHAKLMWDTGLKFLTMFSFF